MVCLFVLPLVPCAVRERDIERRLVERVKQLGGEVRKVQWLGRRGAPDRVVFLGEQHGYNNGTVIWVELKAPGKKVEPHQAREHDRMARLGQNVYVINSFEAIDDLLR